MRRTGLIAALCCLAECGIGVANDIPLPAVVEFNRDVRPILSENCYACHGPDSKTRAANLRLDTESGLFRKEAKNPPVVPSQISESELFHRITTTDADAKMPPSSSGKQLSARDVAILKKWIEQGASWQGHWAFIKPTRPSMPDAIETGFSRNEIDRFVLSRLRIAGLKPSAEADRVTLIRRLSFDLTGLPPTVEQVDQFVADNSHDAYEKLVDRLLESPHYGERMAMYWLDLVRFADTAGYHSDNPRDIAPFRDYVIQSFNQNLPFDRFTVEQLAGDLLPAPTLWQKVASGYNRLLQTTEEGGAQAKEYTAKYSADRVRNVSSVWLGATMGCAECHDHKYDPFTQRDFYSMAAFFADVQEAAIGRREPGIPVPSPADEKELRRLEIEASTAAKNLDAAVAGLIASNPNWEDEFKTTSTWRILDASEIAVQGESQLLKQDDGSLKSQGKVAAQETYTLAFQSDEKLTGFRLEAMADDSFPARGPGQAPNGNFVLTEFKIVRREGNDKQTNVKVARAIADHSQNGHDIATAFDGKDGSGWAVLPQTGQSHEAVFELAEPASGPLAVILEFKSQYAQHGIGRLQINVTAQDKPVSQWIPPAVRAVIAKAPQDRNDADTKQLASFLRDQSPRFQSQRDEVQKWNNQRDAYSKNIPASLVTVATAPRMVRILPRGNWQDDSGEVVTPAIPSFLGKLDTGDRRATRLDLANWIIASDNPLPSRVFVNRTWRLLFGNGLSKSLEDSGSQGEWPTHPDLLDWLAVDFRESGWDVKRLIKLIVTSGTYRQSSVQTKEARAQDPFNRLLSAQNRMRLDAEFIRDNSLAISGLLSHRLNSTAW